MAFLYDTRKVKFSGLAGEIIKQPIRKKEGGKMITMPSVQWVRSPFLCGFKSGWINFALCTVHIYYGDNDANDPVRMTIEESVDYVKRRGLGDATAEIDVGSKGGWCRFKATVFRGTFRYSGEITTIYRDLDGRLEILRPFLPNLVMKTPQTFYEIRDAKALRAPTESLMPILSLLNQEVPIRITFVYPFKTVLIITGTFLLLAVVMEFMTMANHAYFPLHKGISILLNAAATQNSRFSNLQWLSFGSKLNVVEQTMPDGRVEFSIKNRKVTMKNKLLKIVRVGQ